MRLFLAVGMTLTGFLMSITAFTQVYKDHLYLPYPEIKNITPNEVSFIAV